MIVLSLCDGISCGQEALKQLGINIEKYFASETDKYCIKITQKNFPNTIQIGDIKDVYYKNGVLYWKGGSFSGKIDLLIAGTPCQDLSSFKLKGEGLNGKESGLFWHFVRLLQEIKPTYFLFENVKMKKEWRDIITKELKIEPIKINSSNFSAQNRVRLYWTNIPQSSWKVKDVQFSEIIEDLPFKEIPKCFFTKWGDKKRIDKGVNWVENKKANCLTTKNCHTNQYLLNKDKSKIRLLTAQEYERLQTLPLGYTDGIPNGERFKCIGNGWTIEVIKQILTKLK